MYLSIEMPLIVWKESTLTKFIVDHNIGITICSLYDILLIKESVNNGKYLKMNIMQEIWLK